MTAPQEDQVARQLDGVAAAVRAARQAGHWYEADVVTTKHVESRDVAAALYAAGLRVPSPEPELYGDAWALEAAGLRLPDSRVDIAEPGLDRIESRARHLAGGLHVHGAIPARYWREAIAEWAAQLNAKPDSLAEGVRRVKEIERRAYNPPYPGLVMNDPDAGL